MPATENTKKHGTPLLYGESGTSLLELMGAMVAGLVVLGATLQSLSYFQQEFAQQQDRITQHQDLRLGLELFEQELRLAGSGSLSVILSDAVEFTANVHDQCDLGGDDRSNDAYCRRWAGMAGSETRTDLRE